MVSIEVQEGKPKFRDSITLSLNDSFFQDTGKESTTVEDYFQNIDERVNSKVANGMKKVMRLMIKKLDTHFQEKMEILLQDKVRFLVKDEVSVIMNQRK